MKKFYNYTFQLVCIYILALTLFSIFNFDISSAKGESKVHNIIEEKVLDSSTLLVQSLQDENFEEEVEVTNEEEIEEKNENIEEPQGPKEIPNLNFVDTSAYPVLAVETVNISHYGHDCIGCEGGQTAAGYWIGDGRTYYNDSTYGSVKVVAADYKYPLGTILRLNHYGNAYNAIVLDRGGSIGDHGKYQIDVLASSESEASRLGSVYGVSLEVLRYGY